ncbi:MAG: hypothetical protein KA314_13525 [Chloroflexi bacterium]|nr:hypothetical protein [Chloroflexota bacterium]
MLKIDHYTITSYTVNHITEECPCTFCGEPLETGDRIYIIEGDYQTAACCPAHAIGQDSLTDEQLEQKRRQERGRRRHT